jgi:hypothetical protein
MPGQHARDMMARRPDRLGNAGVAGMEHPLQARPAGSPAGMRSCPVPLVTARAMSGLPPSPERIPADCCPGRSNTFTWRCTSRPRPAKSGTTQTSTSAGSASDSAPPPTTPDTALPSGTSNWRVTSTQSRQATEPGQQNPHDVGVISRSGLPSRPTCEQSPADSASSPIDGPRFPAHPTGALRPACGSLAAPPGCCGWVNRHRSGDLDSRRPARLGAPLMAWPVGSCLTVAWRGIRLGEPARGCLPDEVAECLVGVELGGVEELISCGVVREAGACLGEIEELIGRAGGSGRPGRTRAGHAPSLSSGPRLALYAGESRDR